MMEITTLDTMDKQIPVVTEFMDIFFKEYRLAPKRSVELSIDQISRVASVSRTRYHMTMIEVNVHEDDLLTKDSIRPSM